MAIRAHSFAPYLKDRAFLYSAALSILAFFASIAATYVAGIYTTKRASNYVTDIVLSNTPVFNLGALFVYGSLLVIAFVVLLLLLDPKRLPFSLYALALFFFIRAAFISMTHVGPFPDQIAYDIGAVASHFFFGDDQFFSGHTGAPFLLALLFWRERLWRYVFLAISIAFAIIVLLAHLHYTIDVLSAFFITYGIFHIAEWLFPRTRRLFFEGLSAEREAA